MFLEILTIPEIEKRIREFYFFVNFMKNSLDPFRKLSVSINMFNCSIYYNSQNIQGFVTKIECGFRKKGKTINLNRFSLYTLKKSVVINISNRLCMNNLFIYFKTHKEIFRSE